MRTVTIAALKNQLSRYLNEVRQGEELLIRDRKVLSPMVGEVAMSTLYVPTVMSLRPV